MTTLSAPSLLERERELGQLGAAFSAALEGSGQLILLEGPAGIGKTSLLRAASKSAESTGFIRLGARANELEHDFAYGCIRQLLEPQVARADGAALDRLFKGAAGLARHLFPTEEVSPPVPNPPPGVDRPFSVLHGLYWLLSNLTEESPIALFVDDVHWSDVESLRLLTFLAPRLDGLRLVATAAARTGEGSHAGLARLAAAPEVTTLRPAPLSTGATAKLCGYALGDDVAPELVSACRSATGGNPFYLEALLREIKARGLARDKDAAERVGAIGPDAVADQIRVRLANRKAASSLVDAVAILGDGAGVSEAAALAGLGREAAAQAADLLVELAILDNGEGLRFTHPIVREAVWRSIGPAARVAAHARAAELLVEIGAPEERIAAQIAAAEPIGDPGRVDLLRRVAGRALAQGAPAAAAAWLHRALAEPPSPEEEAELLLELGSAEQRLGSAMAVEHLSAAVDRLRDPQPMALGVRGLALALTMSEQSDRAVAALASTIDGVERVDRELGLLLAADLHAHAQQARLEARGPAADRLRAYGDLEGETPGERLVLASLSFERARESDSAAEAAEQLERGLHEGRLLAEQDLDVAGPFFHLVLGLLATDALDLAETCLEQALADARARASIPALAYATYYRGRIALRRGSLEEAETDARAAVELLTAHRIEFGRMTAHGLIVEALIEQGDLDGAEQVLREADPAGEAKPGLTANFLLEASALLALAKGPSQEGLDAMREFGQASELWAFASPLATRWRSHAAMAMAALGQLEAARDLAAEDLERARRWGAPSGIGLALRAVAGAEGGEAAIGSLSEASEVLAGSPARLEQARALVELGAALRRANRRSDARPPLGKGLDLAERCGARALAEHARTELRAAGGRSADPYGRGADQLTVSERRVAEFAADGLSNPEIAQALFVTRKTVETHLGRVYRKLDIPGRGALGRALPAEQDAAS